MSNKTDNTIICCKYNKNETERLIELFSQLNDLSDTQKKSIEYRYLNILKEFTKRCWRYSLLFHTGHLIITVGSLFVPALLSVQYADNNVNVFASPQLQAQVYWITWTISLLVTIFNGILVLYKVDKKYYFLHTTHERLRSEGWQFIQLTGRYSGALMDYKTTATHANQLVAFCYYIERIRMRQVEEEYYKMDEPQQTEATKSGNTTATQSTTQNSSASIDLTKLYQNIEKSAMDNPQSASLLKAIVSSLVISSQDSSSKVHPEQDNITTQTSTKITALQEQKPLTNEVIEPIPSEQSST
jgi:hypothetical protein